MQDTKRHIITYSIKGEVQIDITPIVVLVRKAFALLVGLLFGSKNPAPNRVEAETLHSETIIAPEIGEVEVEIVPETTPEKEPEIYYQPAWNYQTGKIETVPHSNLTKCKQCSKRFTGKRLGAKFCSDKCKNDFNNQKR